MHLLLVRYLTCNVWGCTSNVWGVHLQMAECLVRHDAVKALPLEVWHGQDVLGIHLRPAAAPSHPCVLSIHCQSAVPPDKGVPHRVDCHVGYLHLLLRIACTHDQKELHTSMQVCIRTSP